MLRDSGTFGVNNMLITPQEAAADRYSTTVTNLDVAADKLYGKGIMPL